MIKPGKTIDEAARLAVLADLAILDTEPEQSYDDLVRIATAICEVPMGSVTLIDSERQWFKASLGLESKETPREFAFCAHAILDPHATLVVEDALADARFQGNPFVTDAPNIRFYAGAPLIAGGQPVGTFCVMDDKPRQLQPEQLQALEALSRQASHLLELQRVGRALRHQLGERDWYEKKILADQAALIARNANLTEQTRTDPLTGLDNRRAFAVRLDEAIASATARGASLHVAVVDMDHFKTVNDLHGHQEGDRVLRAVSALLRSQQRVGGLRATAARNSCCCCPTWNRRRRGCSASTCARRLPPCRCPCRSPSASAWPRTGRATLPRPFLPVPTPRCTGPRVKAATGLSLPAHEIRVVARCERRPRPSAAARTSRAIARLHALAEKRDTVHRHAPGMVASHVGHVNVVVRHAHRQPCGARGLRPGACQRVSERLRPARHARSPLRLELRRGVRTAPRACRRTGSAAPPP